MDQVHGSIEVTDSHVTDAVKTGIAVFDKSVHNSQIVFRRCRVEHAGTRGAGFFPLAVSAQRWALTRRFPVGNVSFQDCDVMDTVERRFLQVRMKALHLGVSRIDITLTLHTLTSAVLYAPDAGMESSSSAV